MIRSGIVRELVDARFSAPINLLSVQLDPVSGCGSCASKGGCGLQLLPSDNTPILLDCKVDCESQIHQGDRVNVQVAEPDSRWLRIVFIAYAIPTFGMLIGAVVGYWVAELLSLSEAGELFSLLGFLVGLTGGLIAWDRAEKSIGCEHVSHNRVESATIVGVIPNSGEVR